MDSSTLTEEPAIDSRQNHRAVHVARLVLALVITPALLIHAWGRSLIVGMIQGRPESAFVALVLAGIGLVMALTAGLSARLKSPRLDRAVLGPACP